jgi:hypothetical protein
MQREHRMSNPPRRSTTPARGSPARPQSGRPGEVERALALRDVMDHAVRVQREISGAKPIRPSRAKLFMAIATCLPLLGLSVYSVSARPAFIWGTTPVVEPQRQEAELRVGMFLLAQRIEEFRVRIGHLPATLAELGEPAAGVEYARVSDSVFQLRALAGQRPVALRSDQPMQQFLGSSIAIVQRGAP